MTIVPKMPKKALAEEKPLKLNITFEDAIKKALNTPIKKAAKSSFSNRYCNGWIIQTSE